MTYNSDDEYQMLRAIAERRLQQITEQLGLNQNYFEHAHKAARAAVGGKHDRVLPEQAHQIAEAFSTISDVLVRARLVALLAALVDQDTANPTA